jgi:hypothetical protein
VPLLDGREFPPNVVGADFNQAPQHLGVTIRDSRWLIEAIIARITSEMW